MAKIIKSFIQNSSLKCQCATIWYQYRERFVEQRTWHHFYCPLDLALRYRLDTISSSRSESWSATRFVAPFPLDTWVAQYNAFNCSTHLRCGATSILQIFFIIEMALFFSSWWISDFSEKYFLVFFKKENFFILKMKLQWKSLSFIAVAGSLNYYQRFSVLYPSFIAWASS